LSILLGRKTPSTRDERGTETRQYIFVSKFGIVIFGLIFLTFCKKSKQKTQGICLQDSSPD
jgi:hypothetical protein